MTSVLGRDDVGLDALPVVDTELAEPVAAISRRLWAGATLLALLLIVAGAWGWFGRWSQHLDATAIVVHGSGPVVVTAPVAGMVTHASAQVGDTVRAGSALATITAEGRTLTLRAGIAGMVLSLVSPGAPIAAGASIASLDPVTQQAHAFLLVSDTAALARLSTGQRVTLSSPSGVLTGRVATVRPVPTSRAAVATQFMLPLAAQSTDPVWLVEVVLNRGSQVAVQTAASALVQLPSIPVYRALLGDQS